MVEGARLESVYTATYRGFESLPLRHLFSTPFLKLFIVFGDISTVPGRDLNPIRGFDKIARSNFDRAIARPEGCRAGSPE